MPILGGPDTHEERVSHIRAHRIQFPGGWSPAWRHAYIEGNELWLAGHVIGRSGDELARELGQVAPAADESRMARWLADLDGHFALVARGRDWRLAAVDRVRSIPLAYRRRPETTLVSCSALDLLDDSTISDDVIDREAGLSIGMMGYTVGSATLHREVRQLQPGEFLFQGSEGSSDAEPVVVRRYARYEPWRVAEAPVEEFQRGLAAVTRSVFEKLVASCDGRPIAVPISAGLDSRLVAAALRELGYRDVLCFSYGHHGNYEAQAGRAVSERLGYKWTFVPLTRAVQRSTFTSSEFRSYLRYADQLCATPFIQDFAAILSLRDRGWLPPDALIVNGQSGDFISGGHIPVALLSPSATAGPVAWSERAIAAYLDKHARLWAELATPENDRIIAARIRSRWAHAAAPTDDPAAVHGLYEHAEFENRQAKYTINGQRAYEHLGFEWRLPLWDREYLDFWQAVPLRLKWGQRLYRSFLWSENWGGVWEGFESPFYTTPRWAAAIAKLGRLVAGRNGYGRWEAIEQRYLSYWTDKVNNYALIPYRTVVADRRGHRNAISWHTEAYLAQHGLRFDGQGATSP